jgi:hypothetical protein
MPTARQLLAQLHGGSDDRGLAGHPAAEAARHFSADRQLASQTLLAHSRLG